MEASCDFNQYPLDQWYWTSLNLIIGLSHIFILKVYGKFFVYISCFHFSSCMHCNVLITRSLVSTWSPYSWPPFTHFSLPQLPFPLVTTVLLVLYLCVCFCLFVYPTYEWNHTVFLFLWFLPLSIVPSRLTHVVTNGWISFFLWLRSTTHTHTHHTSFLFIHPLMATWIVFISWLLKWNV